MQNFTFFLDWELNCQFAGLIWARDRGLYAANGLDVHIAPWHEHPDNTVLESVLGHELCAGCMEDNLIVRAALAGQGIKAIGAMFQRSPMVLMSAKDSGITRLADLPGKRIAMYEDGIQLLKTVLTLHGLPTDLDATTKDWTFEDLITGDFDAVQGYAVTEPIELAERGFEANYIPVRHPQLDPYAQVIFAKTTTIDEETGLLQHFLTATFEGWKQALSNIHEAAKLVAAVSTDHPHPAANVEILEGMLPWMAGDVGLARMGMLMIPRWQANLETYAKYGMIAELAQVTEVLDDRFVKDI
jgi:ABC-type nitrate/sulfonate/bicarbonate transport system substrate-binding protein